MQKKGGSVSAGTPQSGKAKVPPQVPPHDPQDESKDAMALALADVATYATATLGLLSGNKDQVVTTVTSPESEDAGDKKMPAVYTQPTLKDPPDQQGTLNMAPNHNVMVCIVPSNRTQLTMDWAYHGSPEALEKGLPYLWHSLTFKSRKDQHLQPNRMPHHHRLPQKASLCAIPHIKKISC